MSKEVARDLGAFRAVHDRDTVIPNKIKAALEAMRKIGPEHWEYEVEFIKRAGISNTDLARYRAQFEPYIIDAISVGKSHGAKRIWFADPKVAAKARINE
jgi:hypothetical protein